MLNPSLSTYVRLVPAFAMLVLLAFGPLVDPLRAKEPSGLVPKESVPAESVPTGSASKAHPTPAGIVVQWWERRDIVEAIGLRPDQIETLNNLWSEALKARNESRTEQTRLFADFTEALRSNAPAGRAALIDQLAESAQAQARLPAELMDRGIAVLDPDQHGRIVEQFPWIFRRSWMGRQTARERRLQDRDESLRIQPRRINTKGKEND